MSRRTHPPRPDSALPYSRPRAFQLDFQAPAPSVARSLRLPAGEPAATVTIRFEDSAHRGVLALTIAVMRPELFRIVVESPDIPAPTVGPDGVPGRLDRRFGGLGALTEEAAPALSRPRGARTDSGGSDHG